MATTTFQKLLGNLSTNKNVKNLVNDFQKLSKELRQKGTQLNHRLNTDKAVQKAYTQYKKLVTIVGKSQKQLDQEVDYALSLIKKSAAEVEKNLKAYGKKAVEQTEKIEKVIKAQAKTKRAGGTGTTSKKKTSAKKTSKKTSRKSS